jgi:branched-chain amino acid transport system substrate-binding protein
VPTLVAWAKWTNAHGGISGHPIQLITKDDGGSPTTSLADVQQLIQQNHVAVIISGTANDESFGTYTASQKVPVLSGFADTLNQYMFSVGPPVPEQNYDAFIAAHKAGGKTLAFLYCLEAPACSQAVPAAKTDAAKAGLKMAYVNAISATAPSYASQCLAAKADDVDTLDTLDATSIALSVATQCQQQGLKAALVTNGLSVTNTFLKYPAAVGSINVTPVFPFADTSIPATKAFHSAIAKYAPKLVGPNFGTVNAAAWAAGEEVVVAAQLGGAAKSNSVTAAQIVKGLHSFHGNTVNGLMPPITYGTTAATVNSSIRCMFELSVSKAEAFTEPIGLKQVCAPS